MPGLETLRGNRLADVELRRRFDEDEEEFEDGFTFGDDDEEDLDEEGFDDEEDLEEGDEDLDEDFQDDFDLEEEEER